jgi:hypothetical protein
MKLPGRLPFFCLMIHPEKSDLRKSKTVNCAQIATTRKGLLNLRFHPRSTGKSEISLIGRPEAAKTVEIDQAVKYNPGLS